VLEKLTVALLSALVSALLTSAGAWLAWGRRVVTRDELERRLDLNMELIQTQLGALEKNQTRAEGKIDRLLERIAERRGGTP